MTGRRRWVRWTFQLLFLAAGVALLVYMVRATDTEALVAHIRQAGPWFALAFLAHAGFVAAGTAAWGTILQLDEPLRFRSLYGAFWTGESLNYVFPGGATGEFAKGYVLRHRAPAGELAESLTIYNLLSGLSIFVTIALGGGLALLATDLKPAVPMAVLGCGVVMILFLAGLRVLLHRRTLRPLLTAVARLPMLDFDPDEATEALRAMEERIRSFRNAEPRRFRRCIGFMVGGRVFETLEVLVLLHALMPERGLGWLLVFALLIYGATMVVLYATIFVPGQIGSIESAAAGAFQLVGLSSTAGLAFELLRRGRKLATLVVLGLGGLVVWALRRRARPGSAAQ